MTEAQIGDGRQGRPTDGAAWFAVRCVVEFAGRSEAGRTFEERITLWQSRTIDAAIESAERELQEYAAAVGGAPVDFAQAYALSDAPGHGTEVFSLMRDSELPANAYPDRFFDTGRERQSTD